MASTAYTYDPNGNRLTQVQTNGGSEEATAYTYDDLDRLATVTYAPDAGHPNGRKVTYGHDGAGNRETEVVTDPQTEAVLESKTGHFDNANRLTELTDNLDPRQTTTLVWDKNGNLLSETKAGLTTNYRYDLRDTLAEVERGGQALARFLGDFDERRVLKIGDPTRPGGSGVQEYVYNGSRLVLDVENGQPTARYEWTNEELVSLLQSGGQRRYFALDGLETVLALTDEAGAGDGPAELRRVGCAEGRDRLRHEREPLRVHVPPLRHRAATSTTPAARVYSPTIGRFISQDTPRLDPNNPDSWNLFSYARGNPTRYVDPTGHSGTSALGVAKANPHFGELDPGLKSLLSLMWDKTRTAHNFAVNTFGSIVYNLGRRTGLGGENFRTQYEATGEVVVPARESAYQTFRSPQHFVTAVVEGNIERKLRYDEAIERGDLRAAQAEAIDFLSQIPAARGALPSFVGMPGPALATAEGVVVQAGVVASSGSASAAGLFMSVQAKSTEPTTVQENTPSKTNPSPTKQEPAIKGPAARRR